MPEVIHGTDRRPLQVGRTLFDYADEVSVAVPQSCGRSGRCRECVVEVRSGRGGSRPAHRRRGVPAGRLSGWPARRTIESADQDVEFAIIRRRMRILEATGRDAADRHRPGRSRSTSTRCATTASPSTCRASASSASPSTSARRPSSSGSSTCSPGASSTGGALREPAALRRQRRHDPHHVRARPPGRPARRRCGGRSTARCATPTAEPGIDRHEVYEAMVVANSTMRDLFFDLDVAPIGEMPYKSVTELAMLAGEADPTWLSRRAHELGLLHAPARPGRRRAAHRQPRRRRRGRRPRRDRLRRTAGHRRCSSTSARTPRSSSATASASWRPPARPVRPSRAASCASACPARTAPSSRVRIADGGFGYRVIGGVRARGHLRLGARGHPRRAAAGGLDDARRAASPTGATTFTIAPRPAHHASRAPTPASSPRPRPPTPAASASCCAGWASTPDAGRPGLPRRRLRQRHRRRERHRHRLPRAGAARSASSASATRRSAARSCCCCRARGATRSATLVGASSTSSSRPSPTSSTCSSTAASSTPIRAS